VKVRRKSEKATHYKKKRNLGCLRTRKIKGRGQIILNYMSLSKCLGQDKIGGGGIEKKVVKKCPPGEEFEGNLGGKRRKRHPLKKWEGSTNLYSLGSLGKTEGST